MVPRFLSRLPVVASGRKSDALRRKSRITRRCGARRRGASRTVFDPSPAAILASTAHAPGGWQAGRVHPNLSWTHYRTLLRVNRPDACAFYEIDAIKQAWSARELSRQIGSLLFDRLALSKDKAGVLRLARKGQEVQRTGNVFKDPVVFEFLGLPTSTRLQENDPEEAQITNLQNFLLELGQGFAFVARQERIPPDGDHYRIDLVFCHTVLKCFILLDLKVGILTHTDIGQMELYVNCHDRERRTRGDRRTLGLILCTDKNDAIVH